MGSNVRQREIIPATAKRLFSDTGCMSAPFTVKRKVYTQNLVLIGYLYGLVMKNEYFIISTKDNGFGFNKVYLDLICSGLS